MSQQGWISLHRKITECELWLSNEPFSVRDAWIDLLLMANHETKTIVWGGKAIEVHPGERITSQAHLADRWHWGRQKVRDYLELLKSLKMITIKSTNRYSIIKVLKYEVYQDCNSELEPSNNQQITIKEPTRNHQITTNNNDNNDNNNIPTNVVVSKDRRMDDYYFMMAAKSATNVLTEWETIIGTTITPYLAEQIKGLCLEVGDVAYVKALKKAAKMNKRNFRYIETVARGIANGDDFDEKPRGAGGMDFEAALRAIKGES